MLERGSSASAPVVTVLTKPPREVAASGGALGAPGEPFISSRSTHGPLPPSFPFPTTLGSCLATWLASVGKHYCLCLYSGCRGLFLYKFTVENNEETKIPKPTGAKGSAYILGFATMWKHMASECNMNSPEISPGWNLCFQPCRNTDL